MRDVVVFGAGEIADLVAFYLTHDSSYRVVGFTVDAAYLRESSFCGLPVVAFEDVASIFPPETHLAFAGLSYSRLNTVRAEKCAALKALGYQLCSYISSKAMTWPDLILGEHCLVLEWNNIQPRVRIGANVFLWSGNHIGHHAAIEDNVFIASHVAVGGGAVVGANTFLGGNCTVAHRVRVGRRCVIGANALITQDTPDDSVYAVRATAKSAAPSGRLRGF